MRNFSKIKRLSLIFIMLWLSGLTALSALAVEKLTGEQVSALLPHFFRMHLKQRDMDAPFMRRLLKEYVHQLDPSRGFFLKAEADAITNQSEQDLQRLARAALNADFTFFQKALQDYLNMQIVRAETLYNGLDKRLDEIKAQFNDKPSVAALTDNKTTTLSIGDDADVNPASNFDDEIEKTQWRERPATLADQEKRLLRFASGFFRINKGYLSENDAFKLTIQTLREERNKWLNINVEEEVPKLFLKSFMSAMDPHTDYFDAEEDEFTERLEASFAGIGVQIRPCPLGAQIDDIIKGGPCEQSGKFARGDQIIAVDDFALAGLSINKIVKRIKGVIGTDVKITLLKREFKTTENIVLKRDKIKLSEIRVKGKKIETETGTIGLVSVQTFYKGVHNDVRERIKELGGDKLAGVVLDLRFNFGGYLEEAVLLTGLFIKSGVVVGERNGADRVEWQRDPNSDIDYVGPLVVLVNQFSASASEIVAGTLKDYGRAVIVGATQTFGKGTVQRVFPLSTLNLPGEIKITTQQYFLAGGSSVQLEGVKPDVVIPGPKLQEDEGMLERAYENAIPFSKIKGEINLEQPEVQSWLEWKVSHLAALQDKSKARVAANVELQGNFELKKKKKPEEPVVARNSDEPPPLDVKKEEKDLQADEAAAIAQDIALTWRQTLATVTK